MIRRFIVLTVAAIALAACSPEEAELTTTTTLADTTTTAAPATTTTTTTAGSADPAEPAITEYEVVVRTSTADGEVLWVLIEPGDYNDIDLENLIRELVDESDTALFEVNVFDDAEALEAGRVAEEARTEEEQALVDEHYLVALVDGAIIRFEGPFAEFGETAVGS
ncbi:MAG TPA: hypothetical protein VLB67_02175 [Acidimicrobiia bacterium]|nr:hypothetical protein [Acidimicrobiia bacterium]